MSNFFTPQPGFSGYFGPTFGQQGYIKFTRMNSVKEQNEKDLTNISGDMFLCDSYTINWGRPVNIKHFLNTPKPAAIVGYGNGTLTVSGLFGSLAGFQKLTGTDGNEDLCNPLAALIRGASGMIQCLDDKDKITSAEKVNDSIAWQCYNLIVQNINVTGQVQENGNLFQQGNVVFQIGGLVPKAIAGSARSEAPAFEEIKEPEEDQDDQGPHNSWD